MIRNDDLPASVGAELAATIQANADNAIFLRCLAERNKQRRQVSEKPNASNYAPKHFEQMPEAKGLSKARLERAMDRLYRISAIERGVVYRDTAEGHDVYGLVEVGRKVPEGSRKVQPEGSGNPQESTGNSVPVYKYIPGAATGAAAPFTENDEVEFLPEPAAPPEARAGAERMHTAFPADDISSVAAVALAPYPPEHLRDPLNPEHWPEDGG